MDPNETLVLLLARAGGMANGLYNEGSHEHSQCADDMAELVLALDGWLANGGFLPRRWKRTEDKKEG